VETVLNGQLTGVELLSGGCINQVARVETATGAAFVKWHHDAPTQMFEHEATGLQLLGAMQTLRVPKVLYVGEAQLDSPAFLLLEWIENSTPRDSKSLAQLLGQGLATLHQNATSPTFGLEHDNYLGEAPQQNKPHQNWPDFYRECRLLPQISWARERGHLSPSRETLLQHVLEQLEVVLSGLDSRPSLLHGDLWNGNYLCSHEEPVIIDPAVYYGEREMEIAYCQLFGGFDAAFYDAYHAAFPLQRGYEKRRPLHQLYHLLNHLNHFGESYGPRVEAACRALLNAG
jgi:fructosamine-3-kinase